MTKIQDAATSQSLVKGAASYDGNTVGMITNLGQYKLCSVPAPWQHSKMLQLALYCNWLCCCPCSFVFSQPVYWLFFRETCSSESALRPASHSSLLCASALVQGEWRKWVYSWLGKVFACGNVAGGKLSKVIYGSWTENERLWLSPAAFCYAAGACRVLPVPSWRCVPVCSPLPY